jgi:hypothetical protein
LSRSHTVLESLVDPDTQRLDRPNAALIGIERIQAQLDDLAASYCRPLVLRCFDEDASVCHLGPAFHPLADAPLELKAKRGSTAPMSSTRPVSPAAKRARSVATISRPGGGWPRRTDPCRSSRSASRVRLGPPTRQGAYYS